MSSSLRLRLSDLGEAALVEGSVEYVTPMVGGPGCVQVVDGAGCRLKMGGFGYRKMMGGFTFSGTRLLFRNRKFDTTGKYKRC